jgi:hypothetical protein
MLHIPRGTTRVPSLTVEIVFKFLQEQKCSSSGPDDLPQWFWREFATEIAPTITQIFNLKKLARFLLPGNKLTWYQFLKTLP